MKNQKYVRLYAVGTQGILTMIVLAGLGYFIGYKIDETSAWPPILAVVGVLIGLVIFISYLIQLDKEEKKKHESKS